MRAKLVASALLVGAALANLPVVYALVAMGDASPPWLSLAFGFLAMGLAWGGGSLVEGRRRWFSVAIACLGAVEIAFALGVGQALVAVDARAWFGAAGVLSLAGLVATLRA